MIAFAWTCNAQEHAAKVVEVLPDDQFIVEIDGKEYRALNADKITDLAKQKIDLQTCKANEARFQDLIKIADQNVTIAKQETAIEHGNFVRVMQLYEKERELRQEASQFIPHGNVGGLGGKVLKAADSPWFQAFIKVIVPTYTAWKASTK